MNIILSKRNLLTLLHKLEMPGSACTIIKPGGTVVIAEPDEVHYADRAPGRMHPDTEEFIQDMEEALSIVRRIRTARHVGRARAERNETEY
jgi:hypothetical protein